MDCKDGIKLGLIFLHVYVASPMWPQDVAREQLFNLEPEEPFLLQDDGENAHVGKFDLTA